MNANQLADMLECLGWRSVDANLREAAAMLRRQHEAIKQLREALGKVNSDVQEAEFAQIVPFSIAFDVSQSAIKALKDTEGLV